MAIKVTVGYEVEDYEGEEIIQPFSEEIEFKDPGDLCSRVYLMANDLECDYKPEYLKIKLNKIDGLPENDILDGVHYEEITLEVGHMTGVTPLYKVGKHLQKIDENPSVSTVIESESRGCFSLEDALDVSLNYGKVSI